MRIITQKYQITFQYCSLSISRIVSVLINQKFHGIHSKNWPQFRTLLDHKINTYQFDKCPHMHAQELSKIIIDVANNTIGTRRFYHGYKPWWNPTINSWKKDAKRLQ
eukprot:45539_1